MFFRCAIAAIIVFCVAASEINARPIDDERCKQRAIKITEASGARFEKYSPGGENAIFTVLGPAHDEDFVLACDDPSRVRLSTTWLSPYPPNQWFSATGIVGEAVTGAPAGQVEAAARKCYKEALMNERPDADNGWGRAGEAAASLPTGKVECRAFTKNGGGVHMDIWAAW
jgi:hypothetical protein